MVTNNYIKDMEDKKIINCETSATTKPMKARIAKYPDLKGTNLENVVQFQKPNR